MEPETATLTLDLVSGRRGLVVVVQAKMTVAVSGASSSLPLLY